MSTTDRGSSATRPARIGDARPFDAGRAFEDARRLAIPRRVGTPGERQTLRFLRRAFGKAGLGVRFESCPAPRVARGVRLRLLWLLLTLVVGLGWWLGGRSPLGSMVCWAVVAMLIQAPWRRLPFTESRTTDSRPEGPTSRNVLAAPPFGGEPEAPARVVFMAHHDSKSQPLPTGVRVAIVLSGMAACGLLGLWSVAAAAGLAPRPSGTGADLLAGGVLAVLVALALNMTGNRSPGALDNASGLATLLELARTWRPRPGFEVEPLWVATGAEEIGLDGALEFLRRHEDWCRTRPTILINLDSVGAGDLISIAGTPEAMSLAREAAARLDLSCGRLRVVGAGMDHEPFARLGLCSLSLLGDVVGRSLDLHSPRDRIERVDPDAIERAGRLAAEIAWNWAERHAERPETPAAPAPVQSAS